MRIDIIILKYKLKLVLNEDQTNTWWYSSWGKIKSIHKEDNPIKDESV